MVVTFNRKAMLRTCLGTLRAQERPPDTVVVVDNASTDGTPELIAAEFADFEYLRLDRNTGGAGGFHAGMKWAYERGYEWIWVMDDDVEMLPGALQMLLGHAEIGDLIHCRKTMSDGPHVWESVWNTAACTPVTLDRDVSFANGLPWINVTYGNFEGPLIHRRVVDAIGLPDVRYFIGGDDTIYGFLAAFHARVVYVNQFGIVKRIQSLTPRGKLQYYLQIRNRFLNRTYFESVGVSVPKKQFLLLAFLLLLENTKEILTVPSQRRWVNFQSAVTGLRDGYAGRFGPPPWLK